MKRAAVTPIYPRVAAGEYVVVSALRCRPSTDPGCVPGVLCGAGTGVAAVRKAIDNQTMIEVRNLRKQFGTVQAVCDVSFSVGSGEVLGFLGPNGAGKSTTMRMITGFLAPDAGTVSIDGKPFGRDSIAARRAIGYLPEGAPLYGDMTPRRFLHFVAEVRGFGPRARRERVADVAGKVNLSAVLDRPIETLSKGFKRRVGLAQAIIHDPRVLILDEPTDGLDPIQKHEVRALIRAMAEEKVIILSTHILEEVDAVCTRAVIIAEGRVVADGTPLELAARSRSHNCVTVALRDVDAAQAKSALCALPDVESVEVEAQVQGSVCLRVYPLPGHSVLSRVSRTVNEKGWEIETLHVARGQLDEVFRSVAGREKPAAGEA